MSLQDQLSSLADELEVPGAAAAVLDGDREHFAFHGVTSVDNPLPVDETTLFQFGSTGKTYTATALMILEERGLVDLAAPVRRYVPELRLRDQRVAEEVTVMHLLNHTAGWEGDLFTDTGNGDDALARYVERMAELQQEQPLGAAVSYNNASLCLAGRVIEKITGATFEQAIKDLLLTPLGMVDTLFFPEEIMIRRFSAGHARDEDGTITVNRPWAIPRSSNPAGGMCATAADQLGWARFHLGDGKAPDGTAVLSPGALRRMQEPTVDMAGSALGDAVGITWLLRDVGGTRLVAHGGTTIGQYSEFVMVPERRFAFVSMANCGPNGPEMNHRLQKWALEHFLGLTEPEPELTDLPASELSEYTGRFETVASTCDVAPAGGGLRAQVRPKAEASAAIRDADADLPEQPPFLLAFVKGSADRFVVSDGPAQGMKGYFRRDAAGRIDGLHLGGRLATRTGTPAETG